MLPARLQVRQPSLLHDTVHAVITVIHEKVYCKVQREVNKKKVDSFTSVAAVHESQRPKFADKRDEVFYTDLVATRQVIKLQEQSLTMTLDGKIKSKVVRSDNFALYFSIETHSSFLLSFDKRNELCVSMAIKMKDDKSSLQALV